MAAKLEGRGMHHGYGAAVTQELKKYYGHESNYINRFGNKKILTL